VRELANLCAALAVQTGSSGRVTLSDFEAVWRRQHGDEAPPPRAGVPGRGHLGAWVLEQARAHDFNLIEAARRLRREERAGRPAPLTERSALSYYVTGEILRALAANGGDAGAAARSVAGDAASERRVAARVARLIDALRECRGDAAAARRHFTKLPAEYESALEQAIQRVARG
jgi:hypothetical protein